MTNKKSNGELTISQVCFYVFFCILLFAKGIGLYDGQLAFKVFLLIACFAFAVKLVLTDFTLREVMYTIVMLALGMVIYLISGEKGALFCIMLLISVKGMNVQQIFRAGLITWILSFGSLFFLTASHLISSSVKVHDKFGLGRIIRWNLGYAHPNVLHVSLLLLLCFIVYLLGKSYNVRWFFALEVINGFVFIYSLSSTGFLVATLYLILALYWSYRKKIGKVEKILLMLYAAGCVFISVIAPLILEGRAFELVNKLVNNRLILSQWFLTNVPIHLFGNKMTDIVTSLRTMDNSYVFALIMYGSVFFILIIFGYLQLIWKLGKEQKGEALCVTIACLTAGITEPFLFNTSFKNISLVFLGLAVYEKMQKGKIIYCGGKFDRNIEFPEIDLGKTNRRIRQSVCGKKQKLLGISFIAGIIVGGIVFGIFKAPDRYLFPRTAFEYTNDIEESYYLQDENDVPQPGDKVIGYVDQKTEMVPFSGNIARVEQIRNMLFAGVTTAIAVYGAGIIYLVIKEKKKKLV